MRIKTGEIVTATLNVNIAYRCSACGHDNIAEQTITGTAETTTIAGINLRNNLTAKANDNLYKKLLIASNKNNMNRFKILKFNCKCSNCGYREPWARMNYPVLDILLLIFWAVLIFASILLYPSISADKGTGIILLIVGCIAGLLCVRFLRSHYTKKAELLIETLPLGSLPTVVIPTKDSTPSQPTVAPSYGTWMCPHCETQNSTQYSQCKKCGKYKNS